MHSPGTPTPSVVGGPPCGERSAAGRLPQADPLWLEYGPMMLSVGSTNWLASGVTPACSSFLPSLAQLRPSNDISNLLSAGPLASEAMLVNLMSCRVGVNPPTPAASLTNTWLCGSAGPNTLPPLSSWRGRPSQKLSKLNCARSIVGVLRGSTRRN